MLLTLVDVDAPVAELPVAGRTHAPVASLRVDALVLAPVPTARALVHVTAGAAVGVERVAGRTVAFVRAKSVVTLVLTRVWNLVINTSKGTGTSTGFPVKDARSLIYI